MTFLFDCEDEVLLPRLYKLIEEYQKFVDAMKKVKVNDGEDADAKKIFEIMLVEKPKETSSFLKNLWVLEDGEKSPNALKTISEFFGNESAMDFFTSALPSLVQISKVIQPK